jgi:hypothetical protein
MSDNVLASVELPDALPGVGDLFVGELRVHRQRQDLAHALVGDREVRRPVPEIPVGRHEGQGHRVMDAREDALGLEEGGQVVAPRDPDDVEVEDVERVRPELGAFHLFDAVQDGVVLEGVAVARFVPVVDMVELDLEDGGLDAVEAAVDALDLVDVLLQGAVVGEEAGPAGEVLVVADDGPAVAVGAEVLPRVEAEGPGEPEGPGLNAPDRREMRLGAVLDHVEVMLFADVADGLDVGRLAKDVNGDDGLCLLGDLGLDLGRVDVEVLVDVHEHGPGPGLGDGLRGRDPAVGHGDDLVPEADAQGFEGDVDGVRAVGAADAVLHAVFLGEGLLEGLDGLAADKSRLVDDRLDGGINLRLKGLVLGFEVDERDVHDGLELLSIPVRSSDRRIFIGITGTGYRGASPLYIISRG